LLHAAIAMGVQGRVVVISPDGAAKYASFYAPYLEPAQRSLEG
jgi:hypothetical protein